MTTGQPIPIAINAFRELWVHTGTACNLSCPFCHEGSKPGDSRLEAPSLVELAPLLNEAAARGVNRFAFTGGEPLILKGIREILLHALCLKPVLVLTNGTAPFIRRSHHLAELAQAPNELSFRVSIDFPEEARHDAGRGLKNFRKALEGLRLLHAAGFTVGITRLTAPDEDAQAVNAAFVRLLRKHHLPQDLQIVALPDLGTPGASSGPSAAVDFPAYPHPAPACATSRMVLRRGGSMQFHACPLTDDDQRFSTGETLETALAARVHTNHPRCALCLAPGVDYAGCHCTG